MTANETFEKAKHRIALKMGKETAETIEDLKDMFSVVCINALPAKRTDGSRQDYRHPDLDELSKKAFENGKAEFYCKPANPDNPYGAQIETEPEYEYRLVRRLNKKEFELLFGREENRHENL